MSVLNELASALGRRDETPNRHLALKIAANHDKHAVAELVDNIGHPNKNIQSDVIKTLYELGAIKPELIVPYSQAFTNLLDHKNNRMVWGAMTALDQIASVDRKSIYKHLGKILAVADKGSVITKDHGIGILTKLAADKLYSQNALMLLLDQFKTAASNQLPKYAEDAVSVIPEDHKKDFIKVLTSRLSDIDKDSKRKRISKVIAKLAK